MTGQITVVTTLNFIRTNSDGMTWGCRHYIFVDGSLVYTVGFGSNAKPDAVLAQEESIAGSFTFEPST